MMKMYETLLITVNGEMAYHEGRGYISSIVIEIEGNIDPLRDEYGVSRFQVAPR